MSGAHWGGLHYQGYVADGAVNEATDMLMSNDLMIVIDMPWQR